MSDRKINRLTYIISKMMLGYNDNIYHAILDMVHHADTRSYVYHLKKLNKEGLEKGMITVQDIENVVKEFKNLDKGW